jgi:hypothetical protein
MLIKSGANLARRMTGETRSVMRDVEATLKIYKISSPISGRLSLIAAALITVCATVAIPQTRATAGETGGSPAPLGPDIRRESHAQVSPLMPLILSASESRTLQTTADDDDDKDVPPGQVDKYVSVYRSMQKDHGLTVEQAASKQGMTVAQFRSLEDKIERDDTLRERVRTALRKAANPAAKDTDQEQ